MANVLSNKKLNPMVTELFIRGRNLNISLDFVTHSYFAVPKNIRLNSTHYFTQHFHLEKLIDMNILQVKKYCPLIKDK